MTSIHERVHQLLTSLLEYAKQEDDPVTWDWWLDTPLPDQPGIYRLRYRDDATGINDTVATFRLLIDYPDPPDSPRALVSCGYPWVDETKLCPVCGLSAAAHPDGSETPQPRTLDMILVDNGAQISEDDTNTYGLFQNYSIEGGWPEYTRPPKAVPPGCPDPTPKPTEDPGQFDSPTSTREEFQAAVEVEVQRFMKGKGKE